jgi:hypothetical protein
VGVATGRGLVVVDADNAAGERALEEIGLPPTTTAKTARGTHYYLRGSSRNRAGALPGVDVRGEGGFVVAPHSVHPSGDRYTWHTPPWELEPQPIPRELSDALEASHRGKAPLSVTSYVPFGIQEGRRNATLFRLARKLVVHVGTNPEELNVMLAELNRNRCEPPLEAHELSAIVKSATGYEIAPWAMDPVSFGFDDPDLGRSAKTVLTLLAGYANPRGECWPSIELLSRRAGMRPHTVHDAIKQLEAAGRIAVKRGRGTRSNTYRLLRSPATSEGVTL